MGLYSDSVTSNGGHRSTLYDSLRHCLDSMLIAAPELATINLKNSIAPDQKEQHAPGVWESDKLIVFRGVPVLALSIRVEGSSSNYGIRQFQAGQVCEELSNAGRAVGELKEGFAARLARASKAAEPEVLEPPKPSRVMHEPAWRVVVRTPDGVEQIGAGGPFDFDKIEAIFEVIASLLEKAIAAGTPAAVNKPAAVSTT